MKISEISQTEEDILYDYTYMWNLKNKTNEQTENRNRVTDTENKQVVARRGCGGGVE